MREELQKQFYRVREKYDEFCASIIVYDTTVTKEDKVVLKKSMKKLARELQRLYAGLNEGGTNE